MSTWRLLTPTIGSIGETYATMYEAALENNADIVFTDMRWEYEDASKSYTKSYSAKANTPLDRGAIKAEILTDFLYAGSYGSVCKLFRKSLIETYGSRRRLAV
ncbi:hypothetical protein ABEV77_03875 [Bacillus subtilis]